MKNIFQTNNWSSNPFFMSAGNHCIMYIIHYNSNNDVMFADNLIMIQADDYNLKIEAGHWPHKSTHATSIDA